MSFLAALALCLVPTTIADEPALQLAGRIEHAAAKTALRSGELPTMVLQGDRLLMGAGNKKLVADLSFPGGESAEDWALGAPFSDLFTVPGSPLVFVSTKKGLEAWDPQARTLRWKADFPVYSYIRVYTQGVQGYGQQTITEILEGFAAWRTADGVLLFVGVGETGPAAGRPNRMLKISEATGELLEERELDLRMKVAPGRELWVDAGAAEALLVDTRQGSVRSLALEASDWAEPGDPLMPYVDFNRRRGFYYPNAYTGRLDGERLVVAHTSCQLKKKTCSSRTLAYDVSSGQRLRGWTDGPLTSFQYPCLGDTAEERGEPLPSCTVLFDTVLGSGAIGVAWLTGDAGIFETSTPPEGTKLRYYEDLPTPFGDGGVLFLDHEGHFLRWDQDAASWSELWASQGKGTPAAPLADQVVLCDGTEALVAIDPQGAELLRVATHCEKLAARTLPGGFVAVTKGDALVNPGVERLYGWHRGELVLDGLDLSASIARLGELTTVGSWALLTGCGDQGCELRGYDLASDRSFVQTIEGRAAGLGKTLPGPMLVHEQGDKTWILVGEGDGVSVFELAR